MANITDVSRLANVSKATVSRVLSGSRGVREESRLAVLQAAEQLNFRERFNRTVRYDWLGHYLFESLNELQEFATNWLWVYNHERPNMALGGYTPKQRLAQAA
nr:LacI family DNA-binding transcriptional regulator [Aeromonas veronii]